MLLSETECHIINNLLTELARAVLGNIGHRSWEYCHDLRPIFPSTVRASSVSKRLLFHPENGVNASISTSTRIKIFPFSLSLRLSLRSLASCENETQHKHKEIATSGQFKHSFQIPRA